MSERALLLPMFPLGGVLFPTVRLALHVFEPRYRAMVSELLAGDREFGVVLIERGHEVGGGDVRVNAGTRAGIVAHALSPDGRYALDVLGLRRIRVVEWLEDAPYPRAEVEDWDDPDVADETELAARHEAVADRLRTAMELREALGEPIVPVAVMASSHGVHTGYQLAAAAPLGPADKQQLLVAPGPLERAELLVTLLDDQIAVLRFRVS